MIAIQQYMLDNLAVEHTLASLAERAQHDPPVLEGMRHKTDIVPEQRTY
ncbi:hypothetical protein [Paraburkholderia sp. CI3]